jgi:hypothetical protein
MATKKPMKKPVKRVRRFQEGGETADKMAGLAASSKDAPMGFFERLRMGNIDQEGSQAYNRLGAGRAKMDRDAASEAAANRMVDDMNAKRSAKGLASFNQTMESVDAEAGDSARMAEMMQRGETAGKVLDGADRYRDYTPIAKPAAAAEVAAIVAKKKPATASSSANATDELRKYSRRAAVDARAKTPAPAPAAVPAAAPAAASRNDASATTTQSASAPNESKFDASDALGAGLAVASVIPIVRGGRTLYQAGKKMYQTYKAAKDAIKNRPKLDRPGTVSGEGFVMRDVKDPSAVAKAPQKALPAPRKGNVTDVEPKNMDSQSLRAAARRGDDDARAERHRRGLIERGIVKDTADKNLRERGNKYLFADDGTLLKRGGEVKKMAHGGSVKSSVSAASKRGDGIALRGKTRGKMY